ncbi:hypothetical protein ACQY0O_008053 [Thecaphora frezii]
MAGANLSCDEKAPLRPGADGPLLVRHHGTAASRRSTIWAHLRILVIGAALLALAMHATAYLGVDWMPDHRDAAVRPPSDDVHCPQVPPYVLPDASLVALPSEVHLAQLLSGAVQVDTSVGDGWPSVANDPQRWEHVFAPFRAYLARSFPLLHAPDSPVRLDLVNNHGLLYTWTGNRTNWKPVVLMAHQDVVPVEPATVDRWTHPPFSGKIANGLVWGRGACDCKTTIVAVLASLEALLAAGHQPQRTLIASFGFDEESSGNEGGKKLATVLVERYGRHGVSMIVDEGGFVMRADDAELGVGVAVATPAVAEKGYLDARITVTAPGGHSSMPRPHTSIGYLAQIVTAIEAHPHPAVLRRKNPTLQLLQCVRDAPGIDPRLSKALRRLERLQSGSDRSWLFGGAARRRRLRETEERVLELLGEARRFAFQTTQAVDLISGGVKVNALPETASVVVNHRIDIGSSVDEVRKWLHDVIKPLAERLELELLPYHVADLANSSEAGAVKRGQSKGQIHLEDAFSSALEPAPLTPLAAPPWRLLSSIIRNIWSDPEPVLVAPALMTGNTDTKSYWNVSRHIFRFSPASLKPWPAEVGGNNAHTVNEAALVDDVVVSVRFYTQLLQAVSIEDL